MPHTAPLASPEPSHPALTRLILASASPRRQSLLRDAGYHFEVIPADIDESAHPPDLGPADMAAYLALAKARTISSRFPDALVLAADTVVAVENRIFSKPENAAHARQMLRLLSGTTHQVITGVALCRTHPPHQQVQTIISGVRMRRLSADEIESYIATGHWQGKAGGYGIQDRDLFVTCTEGSLTNIVGLPMETVRAMLDAV